MGKQGFWMNNNAQNVGIIIMILLKIINPTRGAFMQQHRRYTTYNGDKMLIGSLPWLRSIRDSPSQRTTTSMLFSTVDNHNNDVKKDRIAALKEALIDLGLVERVNVEELEKAASVSSTMGYDGRFGKSAIKTFQSFCSSKKLKPESIQQDANRVARQIDFLLKRHASHDADWVRHHDTTTNEEVERHNLIVILDNVRSALNVGSIFRTADACACSMVITTGITPYPHGPGDTKLQKSALGAQYVVPHQHFATTQQAIDFLKDTKDIFLVGVETTQYSMDYTKVSYPKPTTNKSDATTTAIILGNEVTGVDTNILQQMNTLVEIPMYGTKNSLNIAACAPVILYEILRQWNN